MDDGLFALTALLCSTALVLWTRRHLINRTHQKIRTRLGLA